MLLMSRLCSRSYQIASSVDQPHVYKRLRPHQSIYHNLCLEKHHNAFLVRYPGCTYATLPVPANRSNMRPTWSADIGRAESRRSLLKFPLIQKLTVTSTQAVAATCGCRNISKRRNSLTRRMQATANSREAGASRCVLWEIEIEDNPAMTSYFRHS